MANDYPTFGSQWRHHSGRIYTVLGTANIANKSTNYPEMVVYVGRNGNLWTKLLCNFLDKMTEIK